MLKRYLLAPGPTPVPPEVLLAMARPIIHHRAPEFDPIFAEVREGLRWLFQTRNDVLMLASSGTGGMEGAVSNFLSPGEKALFVNGAEVASVAELRARPEPVIEPLKRVLVTEAGKRMLKDKDDPTSHEVTVLADKDLPYSFLKKILSTCTAADYGKVSLAVLERERAYSGPGAV